MNASHEWLQAFVPHGLDATQLAELLSRHVATVDGLHHLKVELARMGRGCRADAVERIALRCRIA